MMTSATSVGPAGSASVSAFISRASGGCATRGGGDIGVRATTGRDQFIYVWLELVETQHAAAQAAAAITLPDGSEAARKLRALLATTQRVSALIDSADELLYMHVLPSGKEVAVQAPPKAAPAKKQEEASHNPHGCCCCCPSRSGGGRDAKRGGAANSVALSTRSHKPRRSLTDSESDRDEDDEDAEEEENRGRGRRSSRRQRRRRVRGDDSDDDRSRSLDDEMRGNDVRLYDALVANRIRMSNPLARPPSGMGSEPREPGAPTAGGGSHGRRSLTPRTRGDGVGIATRGRSPARSDRPSGAGSLSPARGHPYRQLGTQSPAENNSGRKRRRTQADRHPSPTHQRAYPGSAPIEDGVDRMSKSEAVGLTAEAVLGMRWNYSQKEYKIKWVGIDKPVWIARRKCPNQAALLIEVFTKGLRRQKRTGRQQQQEEKASSSSAKANNKGKKNSGTESESLYTVEKLIGVRTKHNKRQFLVRWDGYDSSEDTWEFVDELRKYVPDIVKDYEAHLKRERERERKAQEAEHISERTPAKEVPARGDGSGDTEEGDERDHGGDEETLDKAQQRMLQVIRGGSDVDEEEDDDDGMDQQEDSDDEEHDDRDHVASGEQLTRYNQGRYSKPLFLNRSGQQDSEEDDDDDGDAHEPDHNLDEDMDDDNDEDDDDDDDDDRVSIDFSGDTGMRRYIPITSTRPTSGAGSVVESAKELLRRLRA